MLSKYMTRIESELYFYFCDLGKHVQSNLQVMVIFNLLPTYFNLYVLVNEFY